MPELKIVAAVLNVSIGFWLIMALVEIWEVRKKNLQGLRMRDFQTNGVLGDVIGLPLINVAGALSISRYGWDAIWTAEVFQWPFAIGLVSPVLFYIYATKPDRSKPDWGYIRIKGKWIATTGGKVHLLFFGYQAMFVSIAAYQLLVRQLVVNRQADVTLFLGLLGAVIYLYAFYLDWRAKRFEI